MFDFHIPYNLPIACAHAFKIHPNPGGYEEAKCISVHHRWWQEMSKVNVDEEDPPVQVWFAE
jgi:hypothetical protein